MKNSTKTQNIGLLALRISVGLIFIVQGWSKLSGIEGPTAMLSGIGFPAAAFFAWLLALVEVLGGIAVILGVYIRFAAKLLALVMVVALLTVHLHGAFGMAMAPIALLGSTIALFCLGGGEWQLMKDKECIGFCKMCK
jgi:putative oxidoreductase